MSELMDKIRTARITIEYPEKGIMFEMTTDEMISHNIKFDLYVIPDPQMLAYGTYETCMVTLKARGIKKNMKWSTINKA